MRIEHIALYVTHLEDTKNFFVKYFNASSNDMYHNKNSNFKSYFLSFDDGARLEIMQKPGINECNDQANRNGFIHLAFSVGSKEKVDCLTAQLQNDGFKVVSGPRTTGDGYYESCVQAIENNLIEITI